MAQWTITHSCGHDQTHNLLGPGADRQRKANWLKTTVCSDCYRAEKLAARQQVTEAAIESNAEAQMPALEGTERQIAWAETIRANIRNQIYQIIAADPTNAEMIEDAKLILRQKRSTYWIDNRALNGQQLLQRRADKRAAEKLLNS